MKSLRKHAQKKCIRSRSVERELENSRPWPVVTQSMATEPTPLGLSLRSGAGGAPHPRHSGSSSAYHPSNTMPPEAALRSCRRYAAPCPGGSGEKFTLPSPKKLNHNSLYLCWPPPLKRYPASQAAGGIRQEGRRGRLGEKGCHPALASRSKSQEGTLVGSEALINNWAK